MGSVGARSTLAFRIKSPLDRYNCVMGTRAVSEPPGIVCRLLALVWSGAAYTCMTYVVLLGDPSAYVLLAGLLMYTSLAKIL